MSGWVDVPVAEVAVGDEARINGYGRREVTGEPKCVECGTASNAIDMGRCPPCQSNEASRR